MEPIEILAWVVFCGFLGVVIIFASYLSFKAGEEVWARLTTRREKNRMTKEFKALMQQVCYTFSNYETIAKQVPQYNIKKDLLLIHSKWIDLVRSNNDIYQKVDAIKTAEKLYSDFLSMFTISTKTQYSLLGKMPEKHDSQWYKKVKPAGMKIINKLSEEISKL